MALYRLPLNGAKSVVEAKYLLDSLYDDSSPRDKLPTTFADRQSYEAFAQIVVQNKRQRRGFGRDDGNSPDQDTKPSSSDGADRHSNPGTGGGFSSTSRGRGNQTDQGTSGGGGEVPMNMASTLSLFALPPTETPLYETGRMKDDSWAYNPAAERLSPFVDNGASKHTVADTE
ncbi:hypothetical protein FRACYDRAFT_253230 [Fragilariopsis cylindrus CCMP1102]|uniref:Uncharacterized protein n=1 Tax=Fragilariopsis cylindrus CCMP1102 TaxID=635003 RepID=A0A1E7ELR6_9STRA|nr:hypothetical protein FRACYDRAFT_253230 [Fragilariopsis cylindrus CCMP1102]|eukprot:OEU06786.1 hypothetical protein FRACYDRAFT_253230 [Fragilariopsis cylindrus CCMP1102]